MTSIRLLAFSNIIAPYRVALFNDVNRHADIALYVAYLARSEPNRHWDVKEEDIHYPYSILPGFHWNLRWDKTLHFNTGICKLFSEFRPDVIFLGTDMLGSSASWKAWHLARRRCIPIIRYEARHAFAHAAESLIKKRIYSYFIRRMDWYFVYSRMTKEYLIEEFGISPEKITIGFNVGDSKIFLNQVRSIRESQECRKERADLPKVMMLFVGQLDTRKNILSVLRVCEEIENVVQASIGLFIAGDGPLKDRVLAAARRLKRVRVFYLGHLQNIELARYYALSDIFVLPTLMDPASIVLSEALHSGLFAIASARDGSSSNFISEGVNGFVVDPTDEVALCTNMRRAINIVREVPESDRKARIIASVADYTIESYAERLVYSARQICDVARE
jgi:glycosyltransferase involved in cell wall biosynthesis